MIKGFLVIEEQGNPVYSFMQEKVTDDNKLMVSGFVTALQIFAKGMAAPEADNVRTVSLSRTVYTFRTLALRNETRQEIQYCFALVTAEKNEYLSEMLEYLIASFLGYESGRFETALRTSSPNTGAFDKFDDFMKQFIKSDWSVVRKKARPKPSSLFQGMLNELRDYMPVEQILSLHPKIQRIGPSYVWLSDDLPENEQKDLLNKIRLALTRMYGKGVYESLTTEVLKQLSTKESQRP